MNQKKAKALRKACLEFPKVLHKYKDGDNRTVIRHVSPYRMAKKYWRGSIRQAVRSAERQIMLMDSLGIYKIA